MASGILGAVCKSFGSLSLNASRFAVGDVSCRVISTQGYPLAFRATDTLQGGIPQIPGRKKKVDKSMTIEKERKRRKRIEKEMRKLQKRQAPLKPIAEIEGDIQVRKNRDIRERNIPELPFEESEKRALLIKKWTNFRWNEHNSDMRAIRSATIRQEKAMAELRAESEELFHEAAELDMDMLPLQIKGPVFTPPIQGYYCPDGDYVDTTNKWETPVDTITI